MKLLKPLWLLFFGVSHLPIFSQQLITGYIINAERVPIPFTNISIHHSLRGTVCDAQGKFTITAAEADTLIISNVGYQTKKMIAGALSVNSTIILDAIYHTLPDVTVTDISKFSIRETVGFKHYKKNGGFQLKPGSQVAVLIINPFKRKVWVEKIHFNIKAFGGCRHSFRIRILHVTESGPGTDILEEQVFADRNNLSVDNTIDISAYRVIMPVNGMYVCLEWMNDGTCSADKYCTITGTLDARNTHVFLNYMDQKWSRVPQTENRGLHLITPLIYIDVLQ